MCSNCNPGTVPATYVITPNGLANGTFCDNAAAINGVPIVLDFDDVTFPECYWQFPERIVDCDVSQSEINLGNAGQRLVAITFQGAGTSQQLSWTEAVASPHDCSAPYQLLGSNAVVIGADLYDITNATFDVVAQ